MRLPGKVLMEFRGRPLLGYIVDRLSKYRNNIVVLTSTNRKDDSIREFCRAEKIGVIRGSEQNVLERFIYGVSLYECDFVVRLCADSPFYHDGMIDSILKESSPAFDINSTRLLLPDGSIRRFSPKGLSVDVIKANSLAKIQHINELSAFDVEHVIPVFYRKPYRFNIVKALEKREGEYAIDNYEDFIRLENMELPGWLEV